MTICCGLFHLLNTVLNLLNIHIYVVNILGGSCNIVSNIEHVQRPLQMAILNSASDTKQWSRSHNMWSPSHNMWPPSHNTWSPSHNMWL